MPQEAHDQLRGDAPLLFAIGQRVGNAGDDIGKGDAALGVALRIEEYLDMADMVGMRAFQIGPGQVVEILRRQQHRHALIIDIQKVLQVTEIIGFANILDAGEGKLHAIALRQRKQHFGLERTFDMQVQFGLGQPVDIGVALVRVVMAALCQAKQ